MRPIALFLVFIGVLMTVTSAYISNRLLEANNVETQKLQHKALSVDKRIDNLWQHTLSAEEKKNMLINVRSLADKKSNIEIAENFSKNWVVGISKANAIDISLISDQLLLLDNLQSKLTDKINDLYLERISFVKDEEAIMDDNTRLKTFALLLQVMGLIFVLSKDVFRRD
jgi:hypothetical protein